MFKILSVLSAVAVLSVTGSAAATIDPKTNHSSYWGENCKKTEMSGEVMTYSVTESNTTKVIVKGGTGYKVYTQAPFTNLTAPLNSKNGKNYAISHVIVCKGGVVQGDNTDKPGKPADEQNGGGAGQDQPKGEGEGQEALPATTELPKTGSGDTAKLGAIVGLASIGGYLASAKYQARKSSENF